MLTAFKAVSKRQLKAKLALTRWRRRLVFWGGAIAVGLAAAGFALSANWVTGLFAHITGG